MLRQLLKHAKYALLVAILLATNAYSLTTADATAMAVGETDARVEALNKALNTMSAQADDTTAAFIQAMTDDTVKLSAGKVFILKGDKAVDPVSGAETPAPANLEDIINNNRMRGELDAALAGLKLFSIDETTRGAAIKALQTETDASKLPLIQKAYAAETAPALKAQLDMLRAALLLNSSNKTERLEAAKLLSTSTNTTFI